VETDWELLALELTKLPSTYYPITVCIYWKDYLLSRHKPFHPDKIVPDIYQNSVLEVDNSIKLPYLFVKTHEEYANLQNIFSASKFSHIKHIYIYKCNRFTGIILSFSS
jgi:hypothetical protein